MQQYPGGPQDSYGQQSHGLQDSYGQQPYYQQPYGVPYTYDPPYPVGQPPRSSGNGKVIGLVVGLLLAVVVVVVLAVALTVVLVNRSDSDASTAAGSQSRSTTRTHSSTTTAWSTTTTGYKGSGWIGTFTGTVPSGDRHTFTFTNDDPIDGRLIIAGTNGGFCQLAVSQSTRYSATRAFLHLEILDNNGCRNADGTASLSGDTLTIEYSDYTFTLQRQ